MPTMTMPFDYYCLSVMDKLTQRICSKCNCSFSSKIARINHQKIHRKMQSLTQQSSVIVEFDDEQSLSLELSGNDSEIEEFAINNHENSIEYDYGVELIDNYVEWSNSEFLEE